MSVTLQVVINIIIAIHLSLYSNAFVSPPRQTNQRLLSVKNINSFSNHDRCESLVCLSSKKESDDTDGAHNPSNDEDDDPWAGHRMSTDDEDLDDDEEEDELDWMDDLPGSRDLSPDPKRVEEWKRGAESAELLRDNFYSSFDDEKFIKMQKEYSAKARGMTVEEYTQWEAETRKETIDSTGPGIYMKTEEAETKQKNIRSLDAHLSHQEKIFDEMSDFFDSDEAIPEEVAPVLRHLTRRTLKQMVESKELGNKMKKNRKFEQAAKDGMDLSELAEDDDEKMPEVYKILDVGCGSGALFPFYLEAANEANIRLEITGLDLSVKMIEKAKLHSQTVLDDYGGGHSFQFASGDFVQLVMGEGYITDKSQLYGCGEGEVNEKTEQHREKYDAVVINACFGNFYDQVATMSAVSESLTNDGIFVISHPLGAQFVRQLNAEDPDTVPHHLPTIYDFRQLTRAQPMAPVDFVEEIDLLDGNKNVQSFQLYFASAKKVSYRALRDVVRLRGKVDEGFGRGGKKLGFPTANLPSSLFSNALENVPTGVYFGWAVIEDPSGVRNEIRKGRNTWHKCVANVGYSPTFDEQNKEKIVEAHLIVDDGDIQGDFYNETMRLALSGFLRPEMKFPSFQDLISTIKNDVANAKDALGAQPFAALRTDAFLTEPCKRLNNKMVEDGEVWVGKSGGDEEASYEFEELQDSIMSTPMGRWVL